MLAARGICVTYETVRHRGVGRNNAGSLGDCRSSACRFDLLGFSVAAPVSGRKPRGE
jgi:hypothetical protein